MEVVLGALPSLLPKLGELLKDEYSLQKEVKGGIKFLQAELESMKAALEDISKTPPELLPSQDKIWARNVRELSYDIEDNIDTFMVQVQGSEPKRRGLKKFIDKTLGSLMQPKIRRKIAIDIRDIKSRVIEVHERHRRYEVNHHIVDRPIKVDPRALVRYDDVTKLVGIDKAREEVIKILGEVNEVSKQKGKIVSIVGFGGLGKTTLANVVYQKLRAQFDCSAFVSVSQTPDMDKLIKDMFYQLAERKATSMDVINVINELRNFLQEKRYFIVIDDIWETSYWDIIRRALPDVSGGYRIITTTRIFTVANQIGGFYEMKALSPESSRILMFGRIFGEEDKDKCPDEQLREVSDKMLAKCAGVPLAIITIASLLASKGRNKLEWYDVYNSIGTGLEENNTLDNMRRVLSLSYYDMPCHLRACLLYLSMFPEDYEINKYRLIKLWIAEGLIQSRKQEETLFETGESYLNELISRSMIQPKYVNHVGMVISCHVHDMVFDLIRYLSSEENFATVWTGVGHPSTQLEKVRRISLQNGKASHGKIETTMAIEHLRSVVIFSPAIDHVPTLENLRFLRVLDMEGCPVSNSYSLKYLGNLVHLRYLGLRNTGIDQLPEEIGNLRFLQTLSIRGSGISSLPSTIVRLTHLLHLDMDGATMVPKGIKSLIALEYLGELGIRYDSTYIIEELGHLTELRELCIATKWNDSLNKSLVESLNKLQKVQDLDIVMTSELPVCLDGWVTHRHLRHLYVPELWFSTLPAWVNPLLLLDLFSLSIRVRGLKQEDLEILGRLPALRSLELEVDHEHVVVHGRFSVGACSFPCLSYCSLWGFGGLVVFQQGAMPRLAKLELEFPVQEMREFNGYFSLSLGNLLLLERITVLLRTTVRGASKEEVQEAKAAVKHAVEVHPNCPTLEIGYVRGGFLGYF